MYYSTLSREERPKARNGKERTDELAQSLRVDLLVIL